MVEMPRNRKECGSGEPQTETIGLVAQKAANLVEASEEDLV